MEVFENQEFGSIRLLQEAGKTFFCASDVAKALGYAAPFFLWQELPLKHAERMRSPMPQAAFSKGIGEFPQQAENRFRVTKFLLAEEWVLKKSFKIGKNFRLILFVSWSRI